MATLVNVSKNNATVTNIGSNNPAFVTWDNSSPKTWDNIGGTWDKPGTYLINISKNTSTVANATRH